MSIEREPVLNPDAPLDRPLQTCRTQTHCRTSYHLSESWSTGTRQPSKRGLIFPSIDSFTLVLSTITSNRSPTSSFTILDRVSTTPDIHLRPLAKWFKTPEKQGGGGKMITGKGIIYGGYVFREPCKGRYRF